MKKNQALNWDSKDWAYTLKISAGCVAKVTILPDGTDIHHDLKDLDEIYPQNKKLIRYRDLNQDEQQKMIKMVLDKIPIEKHVTCFFERHADGRLHAHGTVYEANELEMLTYRCQINMFLGYKGDNPNMFFFKRIKDSVGWMNYCKKHQKRLEDAEDEEDDLLPQKAYDTNVFKTKDPNSQ